MVSLVIVEACRVSAKACSTVLPSAATKLWYRRSACDSTGETPVPQESLDKTQFHIGR